MLEMAVTGQEVGLVRKRGRIDDGVRGRPLVPGAEVRCGQGGCGVEIGYHTRFGKRDHLVGFVLTDLLSSSS